MHRHKGLEALQKHIPNYDQVRRNFGLTAFSAFLFAFSVLILIDQFQPAWAAFSQIFSLLVGFAWAAQFFWRRNAFQKYWENHAYEKAYQRHLMVGLPFIFAAFLHNAFIRGEQILLGWPADALKITALLLILTAVPLWVRSGHTFGMDNLLMLYVYFPNESRLVKSSIYEVIRHPIYSAVAQVGLAIGLWRQTGFSLAFGFFVPFGLMLWILLAEEPELVERFGQGYREYRRSIPALFPRFKDLGIYFRFILHGDEPIP